MNEQKYDDQKLAEYLLGSLPDAETEDFDELSFTDEDFAAHLKSVENDLIDAYLNRDLDGAQRERFQNYYLATPWRREKVKFAENLQIFAAQKVGNSSKKAFISDADTNDKKGFLSFPGFPALRWGFAFALLMLMITGGFWLFGGKAARQNEIAEKREENKQNQPGAVPTADQTSENEKSAVNITENINNSGNTSHAGATPKKETTPKFSPTQKTPSKEENLPLKPLIASFILIPPLRGAESVQAAAFSKQTTEIAARLQLEFADYPVYRASLAAQSGGKTIWTRGKLKAGSSGENKFVEVRFPAKLLKPQIYTLTVSGINENGESEIIGSYPFRAVIK